ncbi:MAG TPA: CocE/NonD family hydrolase [Actinospica sp.]|nr:CocE/NonD family hydrolase [Actinospica sp.]
MRIREEFPHGVLSEDVRIPLADGTRLYARIWRPVTEEPVPALLEYLPYRLTDWTAPRDAQRHPWYAGHGYASVRVDIRGNGNSDGVMTDEYSEQEILDGVAVVEWLAAQPWCDGKVGMFGISWGGFNALQIAARAPEPLRAIVTVCSTDDRYDNDVHYMGGALLGVDMHAWAATMLAFTARPPDPRYAGAGWREKWLNRLEGLEPFIHTWLAHQQRDAYWKHGSVCEDYGAVKAAVLAVGGWHDPYRDTVFRLVERLTEHGTPVRGLIGPWSHQYPDRGLPPGPAIGFLQETLRWWDRWLRDRGTAEDSAGDGGDEGGSGAESGGSTAGSAGTEGGPGAEAGVGSRGGAGPDALGEPLLRSWICESVRPATTYLERPGRWVGDESWPSPQVIMTEVALAHPVETADAPPLPVRSPQQTGVDAGRFFPFGNPGDLPPDQRAEDGRSVCFDTAPLAGRLEILGRPSIRVRLTCPAERANVIARLCDVAPDGASTLVSRGVLNLQARGGRDRKTPWVPGETGDVEFELNSAGHAFAAGHRIRVALSSAYWPWIWPHAEGAGFDVDAARSAIRLPVRDPRPDAGKPAIVFAEPEHAEPLDVRIIETEQARPLRMTATDVAAGLWAMDIDPGYGGSRRYPDGLEFTEAARDRYWIQEHDPLSARARSDWSIRLRREDSGWDARVVTASETRCTQDAYLVENSVRCYDGEELLFERDWRREIPR